MPRETTAAPAIANSSMAVAQQAMEQFRNASFTDAALNATVTNGVSSTITRGGRRYVVLTTITDSNVQSRHREDKDDPDSRQSLERQRKMGAQYHGRIWFGHDYFSADGPDSWS